MKLKWNYSIEEAQEILDHIETKSNKVKTFFIVNKKIINYILMFMAVLFVLGFAVLGQTITSYDIDQKNNYRVEWYDFSTLTKGHYIIAVQNLELASRDFTPNIIMQNANVDLSKIKNLQVYEWKSTTTYEPVPVYATRLVYDCSRVIANLNGTECKNQYTDYVSSYNSRAVTKNEWVPMQNYNSITQRHIITSNALATIPEFNSRETADSYNGTRYFKVTYDKPIEELPGGFGSEIEVLAENDGFTYHPVDLATCSYYTPITIINNNNSAVISRAFNVSINMSDASRWNSNEYVMVANNSLEVDFNVSNPNTANAMVYFGMVNISAGGQTTLRLYHYGASCVGTEATIRGYDANYVSYNNTLKGAYLTFNEPEPKANQVNGLHTRNVAVSKSSNGMYNSQSYKNIDKGFCLDNANVSGGIDATGFSIEFWFNPVTNWNPASARKDIVGIASAGSNDVLIDYNRLSTKMSVYYAPAGVSLGYVANFTAGRWYHVLYTNDGSIGKLYVDGILRDSQAQAGAITNKNTIFFMDKNDVCTIAGASQNPADMYIDEFSYYHDIIYPENTLRPPTLETISKGVDRASTTPPSVPGPFSPTNNSQITDTTPTLEWYNSTSEAQPVTYYLEVYNDSGLTNLNTNISNLTSGSGPSTSYTLSTQPQGTYYWRVRGWNTEAFSDWNQTWVFTISTKPSVTTPAISYTAPLNNLTDINASLQASDPLLGSMGVDFILYVNGELKENVSVSNVVHLGNTSVKFGHGNYSHFDSIKVGAYAYTTETGNAVNSTAHEILNTPPTAPASFSPESNFVTENATLLISCANSSDLDNDTLFYEFYVDQSNPPTTLRQNTTAIIYDSSDIIGGLNYYRCRSNDQIGNVSAYTETRNMTFVSGQIQTWNFTWDLQVYETQATTFLTSITYNQLRIGDINATLNYASQSYLADAIVDQNGSKTFRVIINAPIVNAITNYTFNWSYYETWYNGTFTTNQSATYQQKVLDTALIQCGGSNASHEIIAQYNLLTEPNQTKINGTWEANFNVWLQNKSLAQTLPASLNYSSVLFICAFPIGNNWSADTELYYSLGGYDNRQYYQRNVNLNGTSPLNTSVYLEADYLTQPISLTALDENSQGLLNHYIEVERKNFAGNLYTTIAIGKTDDDGETSIYLEPNNAFYRFKIYKYNTLLKTTSDYQISTTAYTFTIKPDTIGESYKRLGFVNYTFYFNNATKQFVVTYSDTSTDTTKKMTKGCLTISRMGATNSDGLVVYDDCVAFNNGTLSYTIPSNTSNYVASFYGTIGGVDKTFDTLDLILNKGIGGLMGVDGVFLAFFIIITMVFIGTFSPAVVISMGLIGVIISFFMGFIVIGVSTLIGILAVGGILAYKLRQ